MQWRRGRAYFQDLRERVFALYDVGDAVGEIADALCVSVSYVSKALSRRRETGETSARPQRCHVPPKLFGLYDAIRAEVTSRPDATLAELRRWLGEVQCISASDGLMHGTLAKLGLTHKKGRCMPLNSRKRGAFAAGTVRTSRLRVRGGRKCTLRRRSTCCAGGTLAGFAQPEREQAVFLDEPSVKTNMVREYGRAPRGERLVASAPHGHRKTSTFIGCLHQGGMVAPYVLDGAVNGALFVAYIEQQVVPSLARGDVLIMDNLPVHKAAGVRQALEAAGITRLFLPAYSPDLNPIEMVFAKTKALLRKAAIRSVDALWRALGKISQSLSREECVNYFRRCGYVQSG